MLNDSNKKSSKFATKKWHVIHSESKGNYSSNNRIKCLTSSLESSLCDYSNAYILATRNITIAGVDANTKVAFKNCAQFEEWRTEINKTFVDNAENTNIAMSMYNLIEYSDNYSGRCGSLWHFKRDEIEADVDLTVNVQHIPNNSLSFNNLSSFITDKNSVKIAVPLKYLSNFWTLLEKPLINCKVQLLLKWYENLYRLVQELLQRLQELTQNFMFQLLL